MSLDPAIPPPDADDPPAPSPPAWEEFARAPLVPVAVAVSVGLVADRYLAVPLDAELAVAAGGLVGWFAARGKSPAVAVVALWACFAGLAAAHHRTQLYSPAPDDIGHAAGPVPAIARVRGVIDEPPVVRKAHQTDLYGPARRLDRAVTVLAAREVDRGDGWRPASGRARLTVERVIGDADREYLGAVRLGDEVEVVGLLARPAPPGNPGEPDFAAYLLDRQTRAEVRVGKGADGVTRLGTAGWSAGGALAALRARLTRQLDDALPHREAGLARALLLGDSTAMDREEWDAFARTGVIHVLAISGQHLVVLAGFVWVVLRAFDVPRRRGAWLVMGLVVGYAALTGLRPSALRAAVMVCGVCGGLLLRRPVLAANIFALGWLVVAAADPADPFTAGCQLSFAAVFVLVWGVGRWLAPRPPTPLEKLIDESRPAWARWARAAGRVVLVAYAVTLALTVVTAPLVMLRQNVVPPVGVPIGPPLVLLTSAALLVGFVALSVGLFAPVLAGPFAAVTGWLLAACDAVVSAADRLPGGSLYVPAPPVWWVVGFYALVAAVVLLDGAWRRRAGLALAVWSVAGLVGVPAERGDELRVTFLSVGHGGCTVLECPDGRVVVYDAGSMAGGDVVRRVVAPYLWHRGVRRVDELFLSHADLDHFNGIPELLKRFPVGRVTLTPSFAEKPAAAVADVLHSLDRHGVPRQVAFAGHRFAAGGVEIEVLHPPRGGPPGSENERSLVLRVTHAGHTVLLTGDLEKEGTAHVLALPAGPADVMMAPHHGSRAAFPPGLRAWAAPRLVVVCRGALERPGVGPADAPGADVWDTGGYGAVTVRSNPTGLTAEAFRTGERMVVRRGGVGTATSPKR